MTPFDDYIRKNPPEHPLVRDIGSKVLVAFSLALALACLVLMGFFPFVVPFWAISLAACFIIDERRVGKWALLGIPLVVPGMLLWVSCFRSGCDF